MGEISIPSDEQAALAIIDARELDGLIDQAIRDEQFSGLRALPLAKCGLYVATSLQYFERALAKHREAKAARKREETGDAFRRAGRELSFAVRAMQRRMEAEQQEAQFFVVDDRILHPLHLSRCLSVRVNYKWRPTTNDEWKHGSITFVHEVDLRPDYSTPAPKRKPSAAKREQNLQNRLYQDWGHLMKGALYAVRDYFREGRSGDEIPDSFKAIVDPHSRVLNNFSTRFWSNP
ncbi:MAG: hypothetical protein Q7T81_13390 [Pseudolabrys sp.]|nr:hypothetical protein [Pseudolabrys sp.]